MNDGMTRPCLSALFVDYDNIYLSLKRKNEEAAKQFAKNAGLWLKGIETGALITPTNAPVLAPERRIVLNRCYGNPVPRRSNKDNSTDMNSFPFVRHHFLRAGSEIIDCPPLTAQLKNSSDIRMVMDIRDLLNHDTYYDEFIILSGDADFTPVLHRLRAHARRTIIYANDYTAVPYTAICDGEIQENDLIKLLITGNVTGEVQAGSDFGDPETMITRIRDQIVVAISESDTPVPIESLADRAQRAVGHEQTIGTNWAGHGNFLTFLTENLPEHISLTEHAPYLAIDTRRMVQPVVAATAPEAEIAPKPEAVETAPIADADITVETPVAIEAAPADIMPQVEVVEPAQLEAPTARPALTNQAAELQASIPAVETPHVDTHEIAETLAIAQEAVPQAEEMPAAPAPVAQQPAPQIETPVAAQPAAMQSEVDATSVIQHSISRIHDACQAPPLAPPEYRLVFELIALELKENNLNGKQTIANIVGRAREVELDIKGDDVRFIIDVISEADPWFEQGASASLFAGRFRNFVVARCRGQGLKLTVDELDLIDAWFAGQIGGGHSTEAVPVQAQTPNVEAMIDNAPPALGQSSTVSGAADESWNEQDKVVSASAHEPIVPGEPMAEDELPRIVRSRMRG